MNDKVPAVWVNADLRFVVTLLRSLTRLVRPELIGIAVLTAARECGIKPDEAKVMAERFMVEAWPRRSK